MFNQIFGIVTADLSVKGDMFRGSSTAVVGYLFEFI